MPFMEQRDSKESRAHDMAFDTRAGYCLLSGPPGAYAPYTNQTCFQPCFVPNSSVDNQSFAWDALRCTQNGNSVGACSYSEECGEGAVCDAGRCWRASEVHSPWTYANGNPKVVADLAWNQVCDLMTAMGMGKQFQQF